MVGNDGNTERRLRPQAFWGIICLLSYLYIYAEFISRDYVAANFICAATLFVIYNHTSNDGRFKL